MASFAAVVPIAGLSIRMRPWSLSCNKAFAPLLQRGAHGALRARAAIDIMLTDILSPDTGVDYVCLVTSPWQTEDAKKAVFGLDERLASRVRIATQRAPLGFGDAVLAAKEQLPQGQPFVVALGDHVFTTAQSNSGGSACFARLTALWSSIPAGAALTAAGTCGMDEVTANGLIVAEDGFECNQSPRVVAMAEKPGSKSAELNRFTMRDQQARFVCNFGIDILPWETLEILQEMRNKEMARREVEGPPFEVGLRAAQKVLQQEGRLHLHQMEPTFARHDIGNPEAYWSALQHFSTSHSKGL